VTTLLQAGAALCAALGMVSALAVLARSRNLRLGVRVLLEFLLAAGLLRLAAEPGWRQLVTAALTVLVRRLLSYDLRHRRR
jgi:uncharacterized membrane protein